MTTMSGVRASWSALRFLQNIRLTLERRLPNEMLRLGLCVPDEDDRLVGVEDWLAGWANRVTGG
jgi:uncharacterized protein YgfB (UPF0149 family)